MNNVLNFSWLVDIRQHLQQNIDRGYFDKNKLRKVGVPCLRYKYSEFAEVAEGHKAT